MTFELYVLQKQLNKYDTDFTKCMYTFCDIFSTQCTHIYNNCFLNLFQALIRSGQNKGRIIKGVVIATVVMVVMAVAVSVAVYLGVKTTRDTYEVMFSLN